MLSKNEFERYCYHTHRLSLSAIEYIKTVRNNPPSRMVGRHAKNNVISFVPSKKMKRTISTESRGPEKSFKTFVESDERYFEIWDQVEPVKVEKVDKRGVKRKGTYTADFLVLTNEGPRVVEVKAKSEIEELLVNQPDNWIEKSDGTFAYLPAVKAFSDIDIAHQVFAYEPSMRVKVFNLDLLNQYRALGPVCEQTNSKIKGLFEESFAWNMQDLKRQLGHHSYNEILKLISEGILFFRCDTELLSEPDAVILVDQEQYLTVLNENFVNKIYDGKNGQPIHVSKLPNSKEVDVVFSRLSAVNSGERGRSVRRWKQKIREGREKGLTPFESLVSKKFLSGNHLRKIPIQVREFLDKFIRDVYAPSQGLSIYWGYQEYRFAAYEEHPQYGPVARRTFTKGVHSLPLDFIAGLRQGRRGRNAAAQSSDPAERNLSAQLPWECVAIDHYKADVFLIVSTHDGVAYAERPWVSAMIDLATGVVLALSINFRDPSRVACAKVIRECVRRHGRLPREVIVDRGADFKSVYFATLLAHYDIVLSYRPAAHGRYGGEVEGLFGEFKRVWLSQRPGNISDFKEARAVDGTHVPQNSAILRSYDLYRELYRFCQWRDSKPLNIHIESRQDFFEMRQRDFPLVAVEISADTYFKLATAVDVRKFTLDPQRGIKVNELWYFSYAIPDLNMPKSKVEVRIDPENPHLIYALLDKFWYELHSSQINTFASKGLDKQFEEGLVAIEGHNFRRKIREEADQKLVQLLGRN